MTSEAVRDPVSDHLLTPQNAAVVLIDYQSVQVTSVASMDRRELVTNVVVVAQYATLFALPVVLTTVRAGRTGPTVAPLQKALPGSVALDRTTINAWEDTQVRQAIEATGRKKIIMAALWTEACLTFPTLDMLDAGYEVYPVVDAVGGTSVPAHQTALQRLGQAGAQPVSWVQMGCELQRDWDRSDTAPRFSEILFAVEGA